MNLKMDSDSNIDPIEYNNNVEMKELHLKDDQQQSNSEKDRGEHKKNKKKKREKRDREKYHRDDKKTSSTVTSTGYPHNLKIKFLLSAVIHIS